VKLPGKAELSALASQRLDTVVLAEIARARRRIHDLERRYPSAGARELSERLIDSKKRVGSTTGAVSGLFGLVSIPADLILVTYLQCVLLVELATLYKANLKNERGRDELLDLLGYANGVGPIVRAGPKLLGRVALSVFERGGLPTLGRAFPVVAAPLTAYLNSKAIDRVGQEAVRFYEHRK
jgi:uncharacterized protein (DUF697 family)